MDKPVAARMNYLSAAKRPPGSKPSHSPAAAKASMAEEEDLIEGHSGADPAPLPALHEAAACGMDEEVLQLVAEGANVRARVDSTGDTAMHVAARTDCVGGEGEGAAAAAAAAAAAGAVLAALLRSGAELEARNNRGRTPLFEVSERFEGGGIS